MSRSNRFPTRGRAGGIGISSRGGDIDSFPGKCIFISRIWNGGGNRLSRRFRAHLGGHVHNHPHIPLIAAGQSDVVAVSQITVRPGGCDGKVPNCLPIMPGWNYMVRLYRPGAEIFTATFPQPQKTKAEAAKA